MGFEKWQNAIKTAKIPDDKWETLQEAPSQGTPLGPMIIKKFLQKDGDVIEVDLTGRERRSIGNFLRALRIARSSDKTDFLLRYSEDQKTAYIKRVG